jgi:predicted RNase H-like nuclease (RuvC/YqgF family)
MLLNEFLKEHRKVQEQQRQIDSLKAELKEQRDLIQKVSDRVEMTKSTELFTKNPSAGDVCSHSIGCLAWLRRARHSEAATSAS